MQHRWALTGLGLALLVLLVLPSSQIKMGAAQLHGIVGSYTGGHYWQTSYTNTGGLDSWHYSNGYSAQSGSAAWNLTDNSGQITNNTYLDAKVTGTVTAKLTWVPATGQTNTTDPPPTNVIVTETGSASWMNGGSGANGAGAANDGWGDPVTNGRSSGTRYVMEDGSSGTITMPAITVEANTPGWTSLSQLNATAAASFTATGSSVTIQLTGQNSSYQALVGQQITAQVITGIGTVVSNNWAVTGSGPFKTYNENYTSNQKVALSNGNGDYTGQKFGSIGFPVGSCPSFPERRGSLS